MSGVKIYPRKIQSRLQTMDRKLTELQSYVKEEKKALNEVITKNEELKGNAWDSARRYISDIQNPLLDTTLFWLDTHKAANGHYCKETDRLPGVSCLDQDALEDNLSYWENRLDRQYNRKYPNYSIIRRCRNMIREINSKLDAITNFLSITSSTYDQTKVIQRILEKADTELEKVSYDAKSGVLVFASLNHDWLLELEGKAVEKFMMDNQLTEADIKRLGFTASEVTAMYKAVTSEEDEKLLAGLMKGDYEAAFLANSKEISIPMIMVMVEIVLRISFGEGAEADKELQKVMNALLKPQRAQGPYSNVVAGMYFNNNSMGHLENLYAGTCSLLDLESLLLYYPECLTQEALDQVLVRNEKLQALATMYGSCNDILSRDMAGTMYSIKELTDIDLSKLLYAKGTNCYSYEIFYHGKERTYSSSGFGRTIEFEKKHVIKTLILETQGDLDGLMKLENLKMLYEEKERLSGEAWGDFLSGAGITYLTGVNPVLGLSIGLITSVAQENIGDSAYTGLRLLRTEGMVDNEAIRKGLKNESAVIPVNALKAWLSYQDKKTGLDASIDQKKEEIRLSWFGSGGAYTIDGELGSLVLSGIYNPEVLRRIGIWENEGLVGLTKERGVDFPPFKENTEKDFIKGLSENEAILWNGGDILNMDPEEFEWAVKALKEDLEKCVNVSLGDIQSMLRPEFN